MVLAVVLALGSALLAAVGTLMRQQATLRSGTIDKSWALGAVVSAGAFALQIAALIVGTVLLVQPIIVLSVLFELFIQRRWTGRKPSSGQWLSGAAVAVGVGVFLVFARPVPAEHGRQTWVLDLAIIGFLVAVLVLFALARRRSGNVAGMLFGIVSGSLFGLMAVQIGSLSAAYDGPVWLLTNPTLYICIVTGFLGVAAQQRSFTSGSLQASYPAMVASEPIVSMALSLAVLGEKLSSHSLGTYIGVLGVVVMVGGVIGVARATAAAEVEAELEAEAER